jgi:hypothetical protein
MDEMVNSGDVKASDPVVVEAKHGQGLRKLVEMRRGQLELALGQLQKDQDAAKRTDIETALGALQSLLTGDLDQIPEAVAAELSQWMESSKYLGAKEARRIEEVLREHTKMVKAAETARQPAPAPKPDEVKQ